MEDSKPNQRHLYMHQLAGSAHPSCYWSSQGSSHVLKLKKSAETTSHDINTAFDPFNQGPRTWSASILAPSSTDQELAAKKSAGNTDNAQMIREQYLNSIRLFGYKYLLPLGISKTMQAMVEEEEAVEADNHEEIDNPLDISNPPIDTNDDIASILEETNGQASDWDRPETEDSSTAGELPLDLDADIPDASGSDYDNAYDDYDEGQYQEGFMTEDEYDLPSQDRSRIHSEIADEQEMHELESQSFSGGRENTTEMTDEHSHPSFIVHSSIDMSHSLLIDPDEPDDEDMSIGL